MLFSRSILIPANTTKADPLVSSIPIVEGTIRRVWVRWRWGSANLCGCRLLYASFQFWPFAMTEWFPSTTLNTVFEEDFMIADSPHHIKVVAYNLDDTFPHNLWVAFEIHRPQGLGRLGDFLTYMQGQG